MSEEKSLEGWVPALSETLTLAQVVDLAFDYRGNVTVVKTDGTEMVGYIFNRDSDGQQPYVQMFDEAGSGPIKVMYSEIENIKFTGKDAAWGKSWEAWVKRRGKGEARKVEDEKGETWGSPGGA